MSLAEKNKVETHWMVWVLRYVHVEYRGTFLEGNAEHG